jgi:hypothetical protein
MRTINCSLTVGSPRDRGCRAGWFTGYITSKRLVLFSVALLAIAITAVPAAAQGGNCLQNEYNIFNGAAPGSTSNSLALNCTAGDVKIAQVTNIRDPLTGARLTTCFQGSTFSFIADFEILTTSSQARENIGLYIATNSTTQALTGSCVNNIISPQHACPGATTTPPIQCGSDNYHETDAPPDNCGDTSSGDLSGTFGAGAEKVTLRIDNFSCTAPAGSTTLVLPNCTSWQIPGGTNQCVSSSPSFPYQIAAVPGTKSKCNCSVISLPITPVTVAPIVQKACTTATSTPSTPTFTQNPNVASPTSCSAGAEGSTVTYTVAITNTSTTSGNNVVVDQICDNRYGNVFTASGFTPPCAGGTVGTATNGTCPPGPIAPGATGTCTFTAVQGENGSVTDTVSASGHSSINTSSTFTNTQSNSVTVTSTDAPSTATVTKGLDSTQAGCATVRYNVDVKNTSGADETLSLSAFNDSAYGSITSLQGSVLGTTCGVATALGTLSGSAGAGALPATLSVGGSDYTCKFDAQFCGALATIITTAGTCTSGTCTVGKAGGCSLNSDCNVTCLGLQHVNKVTGTIVGDESETVTQTGNTFTVDECFTSFTSSTTP